MTLSSFPRSYWHASMLAFMETLAYQAARTVAPLFIVASPESAGVGLGMAEKGTIFAAWALVQCLVPLLSGSFSDRFGAGRSLVVAFVLFALGYAGLAFAPEAAAQVDSAGVPRAAFWVTMTFSLTVALGAGIFKPPCHGAVAASLQGDARHFGWGVFYFITNVGSAVAPWMAGWLRGDDAWRRVFLAAGALSLVNVIVSALLFRVDARSGNARTDAVTPRVDNRTPGRLLIETVTTLWHDRRLLWFLLSFSCYWFIVMQLYDLVPNYISDWVTQGGSRVFPADAAGRVKPEFVIGLSPMTIVLLVVPLSWVLRRRGSLPLIAFGMLLSSAALASLGLSRSVWHCGLMVVLFAVGEMICMPLFTSHIGALAPAGRKGQYMGYANLSFAIGWACGAQAGGWLYSRTAEKVEIGKSFLVRHGLATSDGATSMAAADVYQTIQEWASRGGSSLPVDQILWNEASPARVWWYLSCVGLVGAVSMVMLWRSGAAAGRSPTA